MGPTMKDLGIDQLPPDQRVALALEIWESLDESTAVPPLTPAQAAELSRRDKDLDDHPEIALTWEQILTRIESPRVAGAGTLREAPE